MSEYGLIGRKLGHSWSPEIHEYFGSVPYGLYEIEPEDLEVFLRATSLAAMNVTIPYKKAVIPFCAGLSDTARKLGSVNTLVRRSDGWFGDNTDYYGFCMMLRNAGIDPHEKKALVLGSGGASLTVCAALRDLGAESITVISRSGTDNYNNLHLHANAEIIINTTPVGMFPNNGEAPVDLRLFPACIGVADLIYNPQKTKLILDAEELGIRCCGGLSMLVAQAKRASELFTGKNLPDGLIPEITDTLRKKMRNVVLIGMPGCGKSTIAALISEALGMPTVDTDTEIVRTAGTSIPDIFEKFGESAFRERETAVLRDISKKTSQIIATGGGCVTREENRPLLHQNGTVIWLKRNIEALPKEGRPLSQTMDTSEMYRIREPLYRSFAHYIVENEGSPAETVQKILEVLK